MYLGGWDSIKSWVYPVLLAVIALGFDAADRRVPFSLLGTGPLDEVAHLATAALGLLVVARFIEVPRGFYVAALVASVAIDLDHIPPYLGLSGKQAERPVTHSLATVVIFAVSAIVSRRHRAMLAGASTGLVLHFARDIAEGPPGVRMLWPLKQTAWTASFWWFLGMIITLAVTQLIVVGVDVPSTRVCLFTRPHPSRSTPGEQARRVASDDCIPVTRAKKPD